MPQIFITNHVRVPPNLFKNLKGAVNQKRLKNTGLVIHKNNYCSVLLELLFLHQTDLAGLGSRVTDLEAQLTSAQNDLHQSLENLNKTLDSFESQKVTEKPFLR
jgi:hypothetical protein